MQQILSSFSFFVLPNVIGPPTIVAAEVDVKDRGMLSKKLKKWTTSSLTEHWRLQFLSTPEDESVANSQL